MKQSLSENTNNSTEVPDSQLPRKYTIEELYKAILDIGSLCVSCGIYFTDFKNRLIWQGFLKVNPETEQLYPQMEEYAEFWFSQNFLHADSTCKCVTDCYENKYGLKRQRHLYQCRHFVSQDSCMNLLALKQAQANKKASRNNLWVAILAVIIATLTFGYTIHKDNQNQKAKNVTHQFSPEKSELLKPQQSLKVNLKDSNSLIHDTNHTNPHIFHEKNNKVFQKAKKS